MFRGKREQRGSASGGISCSYEETVPLGFVRRTADDGFAATARRREVVSDIAFSLDKDTSETGFSKLYATCIQSFDAFTQKP
jgi:hypothetical protein